MIQNPIHKAKLKLGIDKADTTQDELIQMYLDDARHYVLVSINDTTVPVLLQNAIIDLAVVQFNRKGNEGIKSYSEGGISVSYEDDVPQELRKQILKYRKLPR